MKKCSPATDTSAPRRHASEKEADHHAPRVNPTRQKFGRDRINPAIQRLMVTKNLSGAPCADLSPYRETLSSQANHALEALFLQAQGQEYLLPYPTVKVPSVEEVPADEALQAYAKLICDHVGRLNSLVQSHREALLPFSKKLTSWPILKSTHPHLSQDEQSILATLQVGSDSGCYFDRYSKWKLGGKIALLADELIAFVNRHKDQQALRKRKPPVWAGLLPPPTILGFDPFGDNPPARSRFAHTAAEIEPLGQTSVGHWEQLIGTILRRCYDETRFGAVLTRLFVTAPTKRKTPGRSKEYLIRKVSLRLKALAGVKAITK